MPIETRCQSCGKLLRVADEHAGKHARCPACGNVYSVPAATSTAPVSLPANEVAVSDSSWAQAGDLLWYMKTPEGQIYGPVSRDALGQWAAEGRISGDCHLRQGERGAWQTADAVFPTLRAPRTRATAASTGGGYAARPHGHATPPSYPNYGSTSYAVAGIQPSGFREPHRGGLILTFAILGWFVCPIFSVVAWSMGTEDLRKMRLGQMDPAGQGLTQAGQILGMILSIMFLLSLAAAMLLCLVGAAAGG